MSFFIDEREEKLKEAILINRKENAELWLRVFNTEDGKKVLTQILDECYVFTQIDSVDAQVLSQVHARRELGLWMLKQMQKKDENILSNFFKKIFRRS